jgi:hypothetical protein
MLGYFKALHKPLALLSEKLLIKLAYHYSSCRRHEIELVFSLDDKGKNTNKPH